ncbi:aminoacyl-tRNA hydrolase [Pandoraea anhela]|uniref:Peptidyl-tRNA hydrolase n=1 Tax=Pandoraea anhela TaxID=2508295 RepID=A0A5E4XKI8_9BURK|nr:aminoacyl-tRNA hydrolase [Pandoraea anhela]VVE36793.1 peptidyl-tRNA hydrolase [Pandoraea anhela]
MIKLIVGLGNPGAEYTATRHNAGFWFVDALAQQSGASLTNQKNFHGFAGRARVAGQEVWLLEPQTFMNRSGQSVVALARFYKIMPDEILVVHDELDLLPGTVRLKRGGGTGGHNGLKDIAAHLTTPEFWRLRLGIGHPRTLQPAGSQQQVADFVLKPPRKEEQGEIDDAMSRSLDIVDLVVKGEMEKAMMRLHATPGK